MKTATCLVIDKVQSVGGWMFIGKVYQYIPDTFFVYVWFDGKRRSMAVQDGEWFRSLVKGSYVEIEYKTPWYKFGGITIEKMRKTNY